MPKKVNTFVNKKASVIFIGCFLFLSACASSTTKTANDYQHMSCDQITAEIKTAQDQIEQEKTNKEVGRVVDTGTTVAAIGASMAGVPYIGSVVSIGKTLMNHRKKTVVDEGFIAQENLYTIENVAFEKGCL